MPYTKHSWSNNEAVTSAKLNAIENGIKEINMAYEKNTWVRGDVVTAAKLNHMEDGITGGGSSDFSNWVRCEVTQGTKVVDGADENALILNKSYNDISDGTHIYYIVPSAADAVYMGQSSTEDSIVAFLMLAYDEEYGYQAVGFNVHMLAPGYTSIDGIMIAYGISTDEPLAFIAIK